MAMDAADADGLATVLVQAVRCGAHDYAEKFLTKIAGEDDASLKRLKFELNKAVLESANGNKEWGDYNIQVKAVATGIERFRNGTNPGN